MRRLLILVVFAIAGLVPLLRYHPDTGTAPVPVSVAAPGSSLVPTATAPPVAGTKQVDGSTVDTEFGPYQVRATFADTKIIDVQLSTEPSDRHSRRIANSAAPTLREEVLSAQNAHIDSVSGATITSEAYARSLQAAIDANTR